MNRYRVCIIGCGDIGFLFDIGRKSKGALTHFKAFNDSGHFEISAVAEKKESIRKTIENDYGVPVYSDYKKMLESVSPDVVVISSDDRTHSDMLKYAAEFKPQIVFCEKPLALNFRDVKDIIRLYERKKIHLQVNYTRRFLDEFYRIENSLRNKLLGEIESVTFYYSRGLIHNASHYLDLVNWYFPDLKYEVKKISVKKGLVKSDSTVSFDMKCGSGMEIRFIGLNPSKLSFAEVDFIGTKGRIKINYRNEIEKYKVVSNRMFKGYSTYKLTGMKKIQFERALPNAVENIYRVLNGRENLKSPALNSIKTFELIKNIKEK